MAMKIYHMELDKQSITVSNRYNVQFVACDNKQINIAHI